jgi:predicted DNA-binding transcriptional regulator AlpA
MTTITVPTWFKISAPRASFTPKEVCALFGLTQAQLHKRCETGQFPAPRRQPTQLVTMHPTAHHRLLWDKATLVREMVRRQGDPALQHAH